MEIHAVKTWVDTKRGGVVVVDDDVQNVVRDLKALDERLVVYYNDQVDGYDIVERSLDGVERLVFSCDELDQRVVHRLRGSDHWHGQSTPDRGVLSDSEDFLSKVEASEIEWEEQKKAETREQLEDVSERLAWALDIIPDRSSVGGSILVPRGLNE